MEIKFIKRTGGVRNLPNDIKINLAKVVVFIV